MIEYISIVREGITRDVAELCEEELCVLQRIIAEKIVSERITLLQINLLRRVELKLRERRLEDNEVVEDIMRNRRVGYLNRRRIREGARR